MTWQRRLAALVVAGGAVVVGALVGGCNFDDSLGHQLTGDMTMTGDLTYTFVCNANPDPCCLQPTLPQCLPDGGAGD